MVHVQPGFQVRRTKDDWQTFPKAMTKACKTWVFCSVWHYNNFSIYLKKPHLYQVFTQEINLNHLLLSSSTMYSNKLQTWSFSTWCTLLLWGELKMVNISLPKSGLGGMDERKACMVNTFAFLHPSICNCVRASCCQVD